MLWVDQNFCVILDPVREEGALPSGRDQGLHRNSDPPRAFTYREADLC